MSVVKKSEKKVKKEKITSNQDVMESLLGMDQFDTSVKQNKTDTPVDIGIDIETETPEEIIKKLVTIIKKLKGELNEFKIYAEGTYCTSAEFNRITNVTDNRIDELAQRVDMIENE